MHHDDEQTGTVLSRRRALSILGAAGVSVLGGTIPLGVAHPRKLSALPMCVVRPEQTEGPYFVDERLNRVDIRPDPGTGMVPAGAPLDLEFRVSTVSEGGCVPLEGALLDIWQCDALGVYSDVRDTGGRFNTVGQKFLRGHQLTASDGSARFTTIYPGWYEGRTIHIHFKVRTDPDGGSGTEFTSQIYFDDAVSDEVLTGQPYAEKSGRRVRNAQDGIFRSGGEQLLVQVERRGDRFFGAFEVALTSS